MKAKLFGVVLAVFGALVISAPRIARITAQPASIRRRISP